MELEEKIAGGDEVTRKLNSVVMIQCVGSRDEENTYCSRVCCNQAIKNAIRLKDDNPDTDDATTKALIERKYSLLEEKNLLIKQWDLDFLGADLNWCGRSGSPTKVHRIQSIVLAAKESREVSPTEDGITEMLHELIRDKTIS